MEADEEGSLPAENESWTEAHQAKLEPSKSNPELSKGKAPESSHPIDKGISSEQVSHKLGGLRLAREALEIMRKAEFLIRKKDLFHLVLSYPITDSTKYYGDLSLQNNCFSKMNQLVRELKALESEINNGKYLNEFGGLANKGVQMEQLDRLMNEIAHNLQAAENIVAKYDFDLVAYIPQAYFVRSHKGGEFGLTHKTSAACEAPDEMVTLAINSAIRQVSAYVKAETFKKIGISGSGGEEVARAVMDIARMRQNGSVVLCISVCGHDCDKEVRQKIAEQIHVLQQIDHIFSLSLDQLLPHNFFLLVECVDGQMDLHDLRLPDHGVVVLTTQSQEAYKIMDVDVEVRMEDHLLPWDLFCERSLVDTSSALQQMALQLVKECHCHLLAVILLARALKDVTDISVWALALQKLSSYLFAMEEGSSQVMKHVLKLIWDQKDLTTKYCIQYCTSRRWKQGRGSPVSEWVSSYLVETTEEGEVILKDLIGSFLLEKFGPRFFMRKETKVVLNEYFTSYLPSPSIRRGGLGLIKTPTVGNYTKEIELHDNKLSELPENPKCQTLRKLWLQNNCDLMEIPLLFFEDMPLLVHLDLSHTNIKSLPPSISRLLSLQEFYLRGCELLNELPPHIGALRKLEVFDLEGTEIMYLPSEIGELISLRRFKVSLCRRANYYGETKQTGIAIQTEVMSLFPHLEELSIDVSPDGEWWDDDVNPDSEWWDANVKAIINALSSSNELRILKLYLPSVELLQQLRYEHKKIVFPNLSDFRFIVGHRQQRNIYRLPNGVEERYYKWEEKFKKSLKYINGEGMPSGVTEALKHASVLFLDRHWTVKVLSEFGHENLAKLRSCLLVECNELQTIVDGDYECPNESIFNCLHHLSIHYMKNLESIWQGSIPKDSQFSLRSLTLHTCPKLTTIFTPDMLRNLFCLEELIVEDCPKICSIVTQEDANVQLGCFLKRLRKIALLDLPQLVTISRPLCLAEEVDSLFIYNCPMLKSLDTAGTIFPKYCKIVGEKEWWDSLKWHDSKWSRMTQPAFEELRTDEDFMDQLVRDIYSPMDFDAEWSRMTQPAFEVLRTDEDFMDQLVREIYSPMDFNFDKPGGGGELKQKAMIKDKVKKGATALGDDVDSDNKLANMASEDDEKKIGSGNGGNGKKSSNYSGGRGLMNICQVEGCTADMSYAKPYHRRHKVCEHHAKAQVVVVAGIHKRFCQECSRFHELSEFDDSRRSYRWRLAGHNERQRQRKSTADPTGESSSQRGTAGGTQLMEIVCGG
ncbi:disease resistance protein At4g27190-like isoform X2 [Rhododendron vialii]|uniref:disease resistance protein At4g27190-like isoform X2 n=1 Tax=Rhododendron vialii TaxID=182163 RepID=UPI00265EA3D6|nr:disease resistance protein At4g27190-like isoform X2 [Rhododendron vialii]